MPHMGKGTMNEPKRTRNRKMKIIASAEGINREADQSVMNWAVNRYCEWLMRKYFQIPTIQPAPAMVYNLPPTFPR